MTELVLANTAASVSELKANPMSVLREGRGQPVAVLKRNQTAFYIVPADLYEQLIELADDRELNALAESRMTDGQEPVPVRPGEL